uniref:SPOR domain-containing protein n=1 Tax=Altererythrobacter segetis TaxID=1104773 RepID=UPI0014072C89|nr:SPOR domain-containing protein [Altererythrobacter segetis]
MASLSDPMFRRRSAVLVACALVAASAPALGQNSYSQPVVQPAPPASLGELNAALKDLSHTPGNVPALLRAGWASLGLDDTQAALGFFRRAAALQPQNGEVKAGLASTSLRQDDPAAAVRLFAEAEAAGTPMGRFAGDRGLAMDLVGNNLAAQQFYRQALAQRNDPEISRRLALSQAIAGDQRASDATLLPLLQRRDLAAYRTRAFALAILGKGEEAVSIAQTMLPATISGRLAPYLRYMPRLTRAQQAAAANLGQFPPASEIGRDDPRIAAFSGSATPPQVASNAPDARLTPTGAPLGRSDRGASADRKPAARASKTRPKAKGGDISVSYAPLAQAQAQLAPPVQPAPPPVSQPSPPVQRVAAAVQPSATQLAESKPVLVASIDPQASSAPLAPPVEQASPQPAAAGVPEQKEVVSLAQAFADFAKPDAATAKPAVGAIDISKIKPVRAAARAEEAKAKAKPKPPANPQRFWVQVATGRDVKALAFDWRRLQREGGALLAKRAAYTAKWGQTRRLLTGPYKTEEEADKAVSALKKKGIGAFEFTSDEGQEVAPLK